MTYETNERIPTLSEVRRQEREEYDKKVSIKAKELLLKAISFYNDNYPNSTHEIVWEKEKVDLIEIGDKSLETELGYLNEENLHGLYDIFTYYHDERQMILVEEHDLRSKIISIVKKTIPGGYILDKLHELYERQKPLNIEIKELEDQLRIEQKELIERLEENKEIKKKSEQLICEVDGCGKVCKSPAGLKSHLRIHAN